MIKLAFIIAFVSLPPAQFDYEPSALYRIERMSAAKIATICRPLAAGLMYYGCHKRMGQSHWILINDQLSPEAAALVLRHEKAHVNGWQHD